MVRLELEAVYAAPENPCANRHVYGLGEEVKFKVSPKSASVMLRTTKRDTADGTGAYELFNGSEEIDAAEDRVYTRRSGGSEAKEPALQPKALVEF